MFVVSHLRSHINNMVKGENWPYVACETYQWTLMRTMEIGAFVRELDPSGLAKINSKSLYAFIEAKSKLKPCFAIPNEDLLGLPIDSPLYVTAAVLPPGKYDSYIVLSSSETIIYLTTYTVPSRAEEIRATPVDPTKKKSRMFIRSKSVFRDWHEDTPGNLKELLEYDLSKSKIKNIVRDSQVEIQGVKNALISYSQHIKEEFISLIVKSIYPNISWLDFSAYCMQKHLIDKIITTKQIDLMFTLVNVNIGEEISEEENPSRALCRYEFLKF